MAWLGSFIALAFSAPGFDVNSRMIPNDLFGGVSSIIIVEIPISTYQIWQ